MNPVIDRRVLLTSAAATAALQLDIVPTFAQANEKTAFMKAAIEEIDRENERALQEKRRHHDKYWSGLLPRIDPFGDWDYYYILDQLRWAPNEGQSLHGVMVPPGFVTDLASIPRPFWSLLPKTGRYAYAAIVHDYLYWIQSPGILRPEADDILETAMRDSGVRVCYGVDH